MNNKQNCKIIQDLLPNYIENLTNEETNSFIKKHLENCDECNSILESMKSNLTVNVNNEKNEINFLKKIRRKMSILIFILIFIAMLILGSYIRKFIILSNITNNINDLKNINNYYAKVVSIENDNLHIVESYVTNNETLTNLKVISQNENSNINSSMYKNKINNTFWFISHDAKTIKNNLDENDILKVSLINYSNDFSDLSFFNRIFYISKVKSIATTNCNGAECYLIEFNYGIQLWVEIDTGLTLRAIVSPDENDSRVYEYEYNMNISDEIILPNTNGYIIENN